MINIDWITERYPVSHQRVKTDLEVKGVIVVPERLVKKMAYLARVLSAEYISNFLSGQGEKPQYKNEHKSIKSKGGSRSPSIKAMDVAIDFKAAMKQHQYEEALTSYYYLKRLLNL